MLERHLWKNTEERRGFEWQVGEGGREENNLARREWLKDAGVAISVQNSQGCHSERLLTNSPALDKLALQTVAGRDAISGQGAYNGNTLLTL